MKPRIQTRHAYEAPTSGDGAWFLVERVWPGGVKKETLQLKDWVRDASPTTKLRKWFNHEPEKWPAFRQRYFAELKNRLEAWAPLLEEAKSGKITLVFGAHDSEHNNAMALAAFLGSKAQPLRRMENDHDCHSSHRCRRMRFGIVVSRCRSPFLVG